MPAASKSIRTPSRTATKRGRANPARSARARPSNMTKIYRPVVLGKQLFPNRLVNKLKYAEYVTVSSVSGESHYVFSCNGMFDPNASGVGHQPMGFDQMMAIYDHYTVLNSSIKVTVLTENQRAITTSIHVSDSGLDIGKTRSIETTGSRNSVSLHPFGEIKSVMQWFNAKDFFGANVENNFLMRGSAAANPQEQAFFVIKLFDPSLTSESISVLVEMEFTSSWSEVKDLPES